MSFSLGITLYLCLGLALARLRRSQGLSLGDALFCGVFWPFDLSRRGIEVLMHALAACQSGYFMNSRDVRTRN